MLRHQQLWCNEHDSEDEGPLSKKQKRIDDDTEQYSYKYITDNVNSYWDDKINKDTKAYMKAGYSESAADAKAYNDHIKDIRKDFYESYTEFIHTWLTLSKISALHARVMNRVYTLHEEELLPLKDAIRQAVHEHKVMFKKHNS